jgi:hypothetical protein
MCRIILVRRVPSEALRDLVCARTDPVVATGTVRYRESASFKTVKRGAAMQVRCARANLPFRSVPPVGDDARC